MHEMLNFIDAQFRAFQRSVANPGPQCWPTWEQTLGNLRLNRKAFPRDDRPSRSFRRQLEIAFAKHWVVSEPCQSHCHTKHLKLTAAGQDALKLMNEQGCGPHCQQHTPELRLQRKVA